MNSIKTIRIILLLASASSILGMEDQNLPVTIFSPSVCKAGTTVNRGNFDNVTLKCRISAGLCKKTLRDFLCGDFSGCDPDGGDNLCQARAAKVLDMSNPALRSNLSAVADQLDVTTQVLETLSGQKDTEFPTKKSTQRLGELLQAKGIDLPRDNDTQFLGLSCFLTKYKKEKTDSNLESEGATAKEEFLDRKRLSQDYKVGISSTLADLLKSSAQGMLQRDSITYLQEKAAEIAKSSGESLVLTEGCASELQEGIQQVKGESGRSTVPFFFSVQTILENLARKKQPIVLKARKCCTSCARVTQTENVPYRFNLGSRRFETVENPEGAFLDEPALIVEGDQFDGTLQAFEQVKKEVPKPCACTEPISLQGKDSVEMILANAAAHKQFPTKDGEDIDVDFKVLPNLREEYKRLKDIAEQEGMSTENMRTFFIDHVKPDTVGRALGISDSDK